MQMKKSILILLVLSSLLLAGFGFASGVTAVAAAPSLQTGDESQADTDQTDESDTAVTSHTLLDVIQADSQLEDFETLIEAAGLADNLEVDGPFTVFAPTDAALASLDMLSADLEATLTEILLYHIINGQYNAPDLATYSTLPTLLGEHVAIAVRRGAIVLNEADSPVTITMADVEAENGVIHIIDTVLMPPVNSLITTDSGSREHTLDEVLVADGRFTTFLSLLETAGLQDDLANLAETYTVFAPTDEAFESLSEEQYDELLTDPDTLEMILSYHLVGDALGINQIATDDYIPTLAGRPLIVSTNESLQVFLNGHPLTEFNIVAANGVIHPVETVIVP